MIGLSWQQSTIHITSTFEMTLPFLPPSTPDALPEQLQWSLVLAFFALYKVIVSFITLKYRCF